jgi:hypothetical protein
MKAASPCKCCGRTVDIGSVEPEGILEGPDGKPSLILYQCSCENTRAIPWEEASEEIRKRALRAKKGRSKRGKRIH